MKLIGVVCEYNPFHNGHARHLAQSRLLTGAEGVVCVMSGDFVQRGEAAIYDKFTRAEAACRGGADLVFELPLPWSLSSAEGFARGAVGLLGALGADTLSFGAETDSLDALDALAARLLEPETVALIRAEMAADATLSFAAARERVLLRLCGASARLLETPNNILAVEYCKAIRGLELNLRPFAVRRVGSAHDGAGEGAYRSASALRALLRDGESIAAFVPEAVAAVYAADTAAGRGVPSRELLEAALLSRLRMADAVRFASVPDAGGGLAERLYKAVQTEASLDAVCAAVKNKRLALSRIRRAALCAALGVESGMADGVPPYARLLAATVRGRAVLSAIKKTAAVPILTRPAAVRALDGPSVSCFTLGASAHDLRALAFPDPAQRRGGADWRASPRILP